MDLASAQQTVTWAILILAPITFCALLFYPAQYGGRHTSQGDRWLVPGKPAWVIMELPAVVGIAYFFFTGPDPFRPAALICFGMWQLHYVDRTFLYPLRQRSQAPQRLYIAATAFAYQSANGFVNGYALSHAPHLEAGWLSEPRFVLGVGLFAVGFYINRQSDHILRNLRKPGETGYKVPHGGMYPLISCPNYFGEILIWSGFALASWTLAGASFAIWTCANLIPRALTHHRWYQSKFSDYPPGRKAVIPGLL